MHEQRAAPLSGRADDVGEIDWDRLEADLADDITTAVESVIAQATGRRVYAAALTDIHARDMLFLWPTIRVASEPSPAAAAECRWDIDHWPVQVDGSARGDLLAEQVTSSVGLLRHRWDTVARQFHRSLFRAARRAAENLVTSTDLDGDFAVIVHDRDDPESAIRESLTDDQLKTMFPELHRTTAIEARLTVLPEQEMISELIDILSCEDDPYLHGLAHRLLTTTRAAAGPPLVGALRDLDSRDAGPGATARLYDALADLETVDSHTADQLVDLARNPATLPQARARAVTALCSLGYPTKTLELLDLLPEEVAGRSLAAPFLTDGRKRRLDYEPVRQILHIHPELDEFMFASLTPARIHDIAYEDLQTAADALASPSRFIRRHAAIILLSSHL